MVLSRHIEEIERKSIVKQRADGALPELTQLNMQILNGAEREPTDTDGSDIRSWRSERRFSKVNSPPLNLTRRFSRRLEKEFWTQASGLESLVRGIC